MNESIWQKLKAVKPSDIGHLFLFVAALLPAWICKKRRKHLWLICESKEEARDNGYWFFRYLREQRPEIDAVYAIAKSSGEYARVALLGESVEFGSFRHWIYYLAAEANISSQKYGKPNAAVCYLLEVVLGWLKNFRVFLQHGITANDLPFLHEDKAKLSMFCCGAKPEYEFIRDTFGYAEDVIQHVGFCRFDALHGNETDDDLVLIVPTWRMWLERKQGEAAQISFLESEYYRCWNALLNDGALDALLGRYGKRAVFCMHRNMAAFADALRSNAERINVLDWCDADISSLIRLAGTMITDFSSIFMDFAYMHKPIVYYQFDREDFCKGHLPSGYFDYDRDGFGPVCVDEQALLESLERNFLNGCRMQETYCARVENFFTLHDDCNCERTANAILRLLQGK